MPGGSERLRSSSSPRTSSATERVLAVDWRTTPRPIAVLARLVELEARVLGADLDPRDLAEAHEVAVLVRDDDLLELLRRREARIRLHGQLALRGLDAAARQFDVLPLDRGLDVLDGQAAGGERRPVDPDAHGEAPLAAEIDVGDARHRRQPVDVDAPQEVAELEGIEGRRGDADPQDRASALASTLRTTGVSAPSGKPADDAGDGVAHVGGRGLRDRARPRTRSRPRSGRSGSAR